MAATEYTIVSVTEDSDKPWLWHVLYEDPDGQTRGHVFPKSTLAWRAAEYGIDPTDTDTLLDIVLHEPFAPHPDDPQTAAEDPAAAAGLTSPAPVSRGRTRKGDLVPTTLYTAENTAKAREAHLLRIAHAKTHRARISPPKGRKDPLDVIRSLPLDVDGVAELAARVDENRRRIRQERDALPLPPPPSESVAERAAALRNDHEKKEAGRA